MKAFKGFKPDLTCRGFQYAEGATYEQPEPANLCVSGFHAVLLPLDALTYYKPGEAVYHEVELDDVSKQREKDSKVAGRKITIGASIGIPGLVKAHVEAIFSKVEAGWSKGKKATTGYSAHAATTGYSAHAATTGDYAHAATTGYSAHAATTGRYANAATTGYSDEVRAQVKDEGSIAAVLGQGAAAGAKGCWLVLTERDSYMNILGVQAVIVDGKTIKPDTFYTLRNGKVVKA